MENFTVDTWIANGYIQKFFRTFRTIVPGVVSTFNATTGTANINVAIQETDLSGNAITGAITINEVPVLMIGGQNNFGNFILAPGDMGLLLVCDRNIDELKAARGPALAPGQGFANLKDAIFLPGLYVPPPNPSVGLTFSSTVGITLQSGSSSIEITPSGIVINGNVTMNNNLTVTGTTIAQGALTANDGLSVTGTADLNGINFSAHRHGGVVTGGDDTTGPI